MYFRFRNPGIASKIPHVPFLQHNEINHTEKKQKKYLLRRDKEPPTLGTISYELTHKLLFCRTYCIPTFIDPLLFLVIPYSPDQYSTITPPPWSRYLSWIGGMLQVQEILSTKRRPIEQIFWILALWSFALGKVSVVR